MATPGNTYFPATGDHIIDATTNGFRWVLGPDRSIDWAVANGFQGEQWSDISYVVNNVRSMLDTISYFTGVTFNYVGTFGNAVTAYEAGSEITFSLSQSLAFFGDTGVWAKAFFPKPLSFSTEYYGEAGDVYLNILSQANFLPSYEPGSAGWFLFLHELGHALGLKHPHDSGGTGRPTLAQIGLGDWNTDYSTVMSYKDAYNLNLRTWDPATPMILDVLALQFLYGKNMSTNAGNSLYSLARTNLYSTYWDAGGDDTITAASQSEGWMIFLPETQLSDLVDTKAGYAAPLADAGLEAPTTLIWLAGDIENATGSNFADAILGSSGANHLTGNGGDDHLSGLGGNDIIDGGSGSDISYYDSGIGQYTISRTGGTVVVAHKLGADGTDSLTQVESLVFYDKTVDLGVKPLSTGVAATTLQSIVELYVAFFNRVPDSEGMAYWIGQAAAGVSIPTIANSFYGAAVQYSSFTGYSASMTNADFVNVIYRNVLGRSSADPEGLAYWSGALANGSETRGTLVKSILDSAHTFKGHATYGWVADLLDNKYAVGKLFSLDMGLSFNTPEESISEGIRIAAAVTPFDTSAAISLIGVSPTDIHLS